MKPVTKFTRLDKEIIARGLVATMSRAHELIQAGAVRVNGAVITAPHCPINVEHRVEISGVDCPWVSPDALKLFEALDAIQLDVRGMTAIDLGAGAGGFTDVLLQKGAKKVYAVDREFGLLHSSLTLNPRVRNLHKLEAKDIGKTHVEDALDLVVADIGADDIVEAVTPALALAEGPYSLLVFMDRKTGKDAERTLRLEHGLLVKKVPESQKECGLLWLVKK